MSATTLAYHVEGPQDAPALVLLHAIATSSELWRSQAAVWSSVFRTVRVDLPGHGRSAAPGGEATLHDWAVQVREVLDELGIRQAAIVGLSLGGMVAQAFALAFPERTLALVLAHTSARTEPAVRDLWSRRLAQFETEGLPAQVAPTLERWFTRAFAAASPLTLEWVAAQVRSTTPAGYAAAIRAIQGLDHLERLRTLALPTLVVAGAADSSVPPSMAKTLAEAIPGARLLVLDGAAHLGNVEQPVVFTEGVGAFLLEALASFGISRG
jgi:3-oxoadipate enol-lactonase